MKSSAQRRWAALAATALLVLVPGPAQAQLAVEAFLERISELAAQAGDLLTRADDINTAWDERQTSYQATLDELRQVEADAAVFAAAVQELDAPSGLASDRDQLAAAANNISAAASAMVAGLRAPDDGEARLAAQAQFRETVQAFEVQVSQIRRAATPTTTSTSTTTTTLPPTTSTTTSSIPLTTTSTVVAVDAAGDDAGGGAPWALVPVGVIVGMLIGVLGGLFLGRQARVRLLDELRIARGGEPPPE